MRAIVRLQFAYQMNLSELHENGRIQYKNSDGELISIESFEKLTSIDHAQLAAKATGGVASECILNLVSSSKRRAKSMSQLFIPVLCTVVLKYTVGKSAKFWNMNSCVWVVWAAQAVGGKKSRFEFFWATFKGGFFNFLWAKNKLKIS